MTNAPQALPSRYAGILFRSRTEARWAVLFNWAGLQWNYEQEGFALDAGNYLPDFFLPELGLWFEVKPDETDLGERPRFEELCRRSGNNGVIAYGPPAPGRENLSYFNRETQSWETGFALTEDRRDEGYFWLKRDDLAFGIGGPGKPTDHDRGPTITARLARAFAAAAAERFDGKK